MQPTDVLEELPLDSWCGPFDAEMQRRALTALEDGKVLFLPRLPFKMTADEIKFLDPATSGDARKNISLDPATGELGNAKIEGEDTKRLAAMMERFGQGALQFLRELLPAYAPNLSRARTSFRPDEIEGRIYSPRHDDKRLHVDAFPSRPLRGRRILRLFVNVANDGARRHWRVGEKFADFAKQRMPRINAPFPGSAWFYDRTGITKGRRSAYDHYMLGLHDGAKLDAIYQATAPRAEVQFPAGATWLCFTDQVLHAALSGHGALEQTFYLPVEVMVRPETAPLRVLEEIKGRKLA